MNGYDAYENKFENKIQYIISNSKYAEYLSGFVDYISHLSSRSRYNYVIDVNVFLNETNKMPEKLKFEDYNRCLAKRRMTSSSNQIIFYYSLKYFSSYMYVTDRSEKDYVEYVNKPKPRESRKTIEKRNNAFLNDDELERYLAAVKDNENEEACNDQYCKERDVCLILIALSTGLRCSALYKLDIDDVDLQNRTITVIDKGYNLQTYRIADSVVDPIKEWLKKRILFATKNEKAFFVSNRSNRYSTDGIYATVRKYSKYVKTKRVTPHKLRATYGTNLYEKTHDIYFVSKAMHHAGIEVTKLYVRGQDNSIRDDAAKIMNEIIA